MCLEYQEQLFVSLVVRASMLLLMLTLVLHALQAPITVGLALLDAVFVHQVRFQKIFNPSLVICVRQIPSQL